MKLYRTSLGAFVEDDDRFYLIARLERPEGWDELICDPNVQERARSAVRRERAVAFDTATILAPVVSQEVWAAGVTYYSSRRARMAESKDAGGGDFYDRVYSAERPELFFKATGRRVVGPHQPVRIRSDAKWSVPEPELTLFANPQGAIVGYTIGNDMSARDIEGENPLYLPQAKLYDGSCAIGPCILLAPTLSRETGIHLEISRDGRAAFAGSTSLAELKRELPDLVKFLFRDNSHPRGAFLMTGTAIVPGDEFTLASGDRIRIQIDGIGVLENTVE